MEKEKPELLQTIEVKNTFKIFDKCKSHHRHFLVVLRQFFYKLLILKISMPLPPHIPDYSDAKKWFHNNSLHEMGIVVLFLKIIITFRDHLFIFSMEGVGSLPFEGSSSDNHSGVNIINNVNCSC